MQLISTSVHTDWVWIPRRCSVFLDFQRVTYPTAPGSLAWASLRPAGLGGAPSFLLAQMSPCIIARRCPHLLPLPGPASFRDGGPTDRISSLRAPGMLLVTEQLVRRTIRHTSCRRPACQVGKCHSVIQSCLTLKPENTASKEGIQRAASRWQQNSLALGALTCLGSLGFWLSLLPAPCMASYPAPHWLSKSLRTGCPGAELPGPVSCLLGSPTKISSKAHSQIY